MVDMLARNFLRNAAVGMKCGFLEVPLTSHGIEEVGVVLGGFDLVQQEFRRFQFVHRVEQLAQHPYFCSTSALISNSSLPSVKVRNSLLAIAE